MRLPMSFSLPFVSSSRFRVSWISVRICCSNSSSEPWASSWYWLTSVVARIGRPSPERASSLTRLVSIV
jgi:hypothetical protein